VPTRSGAGYNVRLDVRGIKAAIRRGEEEGLEEVGEAIAIDAKRRAPIRKVFKEAKGYRRRFRRLSDQERSLATRRANDYYSRVQPNEFKRRRAVAHIKNYAMAARPGKGSLNSLSSSARLRVLGIESNGRFKSTSGAVRRVGRNVRGGFEPGPDLAPLLTSRGRNEIRSGAAIYRKPTAAGAQVQVGGKLKASIGAKDVVETPTGVKVEIVAAIRYAKFVEFPTIHNAAQPFLRPALHAKRDTLAKSISRAISSHLRR
jgi:hypothetical protein